MVDKIRVVKVLPQRLAMIFIDGSIKVLTDDFPRSDRGHWGIWEYV